MRSLWFVILILACRIPDEHFTKPGGGDGGPTDSGLDAVPSDAALSALGQQAYIKASNTNASDQFGSSVAVSADGSTLAVGAFGEASSAVGINQNQNDNSIANAGAVYVFSRTGMTWTQQAYIKASNSAANARFGTSVALSADGSTLAVGAFFESGGSAVSGAVYVYTRIGLTWSQQAYVKASNAESGDLFGFVVALSGDGSTLAVGAYGESSAATGVNGNQADNSVSEAGAAYVFTRSGTTWTQQAYVKASNTGPMDLYGYYLALSADGNTLAVTAFYEDSAAVGIDGDQADNTAMDAGAVYVYTRAGTTWTQQAYVKASNTGTSDRFGTSVALSANGSTLAVGAVLEDSIATGIDGNQADNTAMESGAVYVFTRAGTSWTQQAYVKASNTDMNDNFGSSVALSTDGSTLAVGASFESSSATGIGGNQADNTAAYSGAAYVFTRAATSWSQEAYVKASNTGASDFFGSSIALSADGSTLAAGAASEDSVATGTGGNQADNTASAAGAVYVFR
ncbi:MAG: integrin [Kofleriaceae bacterium]